MKNESLKTRRNWRLPSRKLFLSSDTRAQRLSTKILKVTPLIAVFVFGFVLTFASVKEKQRPDTPSQAQGQNIFILVSSKQVDAVIDAPTSAEGIVSAAKQTVVVKTNARAGYNLYVETAERQGNYNSDGTMYENYLSGTFDYPYNVTPATGSKNSPQELLPGQWGYALKRDLANEHSLQFSADYTISDLKNTKWAKVPNSDQPDLIKQKAAPSEETGDELDIFYGINVDNSFASMVFEGFLKYTAITNEAVNTGEAKFEVFPKLIGKGGAQDQTIEITSNIAMDTSDSPLVAESSYEIKIGGEICTFGYLNEGEGKIIGQKLKFGCKVPEKTPGVYDIELNMKELGKTYRIAGAVEYRDEEIGFPETLQYMQDMNSTICRAITTPNDYVQDSDIPKKELIDKRDNKKYLVGKMRDGNCWMLKNLDFELIAGHQLTPENTDVAESFEVQKNTEKIIINNWTDKYNSFRLNEELGTLYDWFIATANEDEANQFVNTSICPRGWTLPSSNPEFSKYEFSAYHINKMIYEHPSTINIKPTGYVARDSGTTGSVKEQTDTNYLLTKDINIAHNGQDRTISAAVAKFTILNNKVSEENTSQYNGMSIRCVAR